MSSLPRHEFAYLILAHNKLDQLLRLIRTLRTGSPNAAILLHQDAKSALPDTAALREQGVSLVAPRVSVMWGDASQLDALLGSIDYALKHVDFSWLSIISGQGYPLRPLSVIEAELRQTKYDAFVKAEPVIAGPYRVRYYAHYWPLPRFRYAYRLPTKLHAVISWLRTRFNRWQSWFKIEGGTRGAPTLLGIPTITPPFTRDLMCYKGSDWFTLSQHAAKCLIEFGHRHPKVLSYFRRTFMPCEAYYQKVLHNLKELSVSSDHRRFILWDANRLAHPKTLTIEDLDMMTTSGKDFGRKFDASVDSTVLDALDRIVLAK